MFRRLRVLLGVNLLWLALSMLSDGINTLVLPSQLIGLADEANRATILGLLTFFGLLAGMLIQPIAGTFSDQIHLRTGRRQRLIGFGVLFIVISLGFFALTHNLIGMVLGYLAIQISASITQAGQQGLLPDQVSDQHKGLASGIKGLMDIGGSMLGFVLLGQLLGGGHISLALGAIGATLLITYIIVIFLVREHPQIVQSASKDGREYLSLKKSYSLDLSKYRPFLWLIFSRFLFLLGTYAIGRFLLFFVAERLGLSANAAAEQAGNLLAGLALISVLASPLMGWATDHFGRIPLMVLGAVLSALGALLLIKADTAHQILLFGAFMSVGSAAFASANWAMTADLAPQNESARFFALANFGTAGAIAAAGLFGPFIDWMDHVSPSSGYTALFSVSALIFIGSAMALWKIPKTYQWKRGKALVEVGQSITATEKVIGNERK